MSEREWVEELEEAIRDAFALARRLENLIGSQQEIAMPATDGTAGPDPMHETYAENSRIYRAQLGECHQ